MSTLKTLNPNAEVVRRNHALGTILNSAVGLQSLVKTNLGPKGTLKLLVSGSGSLKTTKDGLVLMKEVQFTNATAAMIARSATAVDEMCGDGTTSNVILIAELLKQANRFICDGLHPRIVVEGFELAKKEAIQFLERFRVAASTQDREFLLSVARTSLRTKLPTALADTITNIVVDALVTIKTPGQPIDLFMVEIQKMQHFSALDTKLVRGLVLDHGARHPDMPKRLSDAFVLALNVSLEYEKTEVNAGFFYSSAEQRDRLVESERAFIDDRVRKIIALKHAVCAGAGAQQPHSFVVINQKGIDPLSLDMLAKEGILALRRAKRRNMERLQMVCGCTPLNSVDDMDASVLGFAGSVYEQSVGDERFTFLEQVRTPRSVSILIKGATSHLISQIEDAIRDGLRAVNNAFEDAFVVPGAGSFYVAVNQQLMQLKERVSGKAKFGIQAFAEAMLAIPKILVQNAGLDVQDCLVAMTDELQLREGKEGNPVGIDISTGLTCNPVLEGIWDNYRVHRQILNSCTVVASNLLLVDEIIKAGKTSNKLPE